MAQVLRHFGTTNTASAVQVSAVGFDVTKPTVNRTSQIFSESQHIASLDGFECHSNFRFMIATWRLCMAAVGEHELQQSERVRLLYHQEHSASPSYLQARQAKLQLQACEHARYRNGPTWLLSYIPLRTLPRTLQGAINGQLHCACLSDLLQSPGKLWAPPEGHSEASWCTCHCICDSQQCCAILTT